MWGWSGNKLSIILQKKLLGVAKALVLRCSNQKIILTISLFLFITLTNGNKEFMMLMQLLLFFPEGK